MARNEIEAIHGELVDIDSAAEEINRLHDTCLDGLRGSLLTAYQAGEKLCWVRESIKAERGEAGTWKAWCEERLTFSWPSAKRYTFVYEQAPILGLDGSDMSQLGLVEGVKLLSGPDEAADKNLKGSQNQGIIEWYTPAEWIERAREAMGSIDLDPASCKRANKIVKAKRFYDEKDDGLDKPWPGNVFLNPPFAAKLIAAFVAKLCEEVEAGTAKQAVLLTNNNTDTGWWHQAAESSAAICFTKGRVAFYNPKNEIAAPTNGHTFFYFGKKRIATFRKTFGDKGTVMVVG